MFHIDPYLFFFILIVLNSLAPVALILAIVFLAVAKLRARSGFRITAYVCIAWLVTAAGVNLSVLIPSIISNRTQQQYRDAHTHQVSQPETIDGNQYPAGTTLHMRDDDHSVNSGTLSSPAVINGLPISGDFELPADEGSVDDGRIRNKITGTLTEPRVLDNVPCAPGAFAFSSVEIACTLAKPMTLHGFNIAGGTRFALLHEAGADHITQLSLAAPTLIFDSTYPAGTILRPMGRTASDIGHITQGTSGLVDVCMPAGSQLALGEAHLFGPVDLLYNLDRIELVTGCPGVIDHPPPQKGSIELHGKHYDSASVDLKLQQWSELAPATSTGGR